MITIQQFLLDRIGEEEEEVHRPLWWPWGSYLPHWSPRRVEVDCDARRRIVEEHSNSYRPRDALHRKNRPIEVEQRWMGSGEGEVRVTFPDGVTKMFSWPEYAELYLEPSPPSRTLRLLALPYADHPDYRKEWTP